MKNNEDTSRLVEVYNGSNWEAEVIKGMLNSQGIESTTKSGILNAIAPYLSPTVSVLVNEDDFSTAKKLIEDHNASKSESKEPLY